jgi:hypothetical protein
MQLFLTVMLTICGGDSGASAMLIAKVVDVGGGEGGKLGVQEHADDGHVTTTQEELKTVA